MSYIVPKYQCVQYPDDTTIYTHSKIKNLKVIEQILETELNNLPTWSNETNLTFCARETKLRLIHPKKWHLFLISMVKLSTFAAINIKSKFTNLSY